LPPELLAERLPGISETAAIFAGVDVTKVRAQLHAGLAQVVPTGAACVRYAAEDEAASCKAWWLQTVTGRLPLVHAGYAG